MLNLLSQLMPVKLALLGFFFKKIRRDLLDLVLIGPENLKIVKPDIVVMIVKHLPLLKLYLACGVYTYMDVNVFRLLLIMQLLHLY